MSVRHRASPRASPPVLSPQAATRTAYITKSIWGLWAVAASRWWDPLLSFVTRTRKRAPGRSARLAVQERTNMRRGRQLLGLLALLGLLGPAARADEHTHVVSIASRAPTSAARGMSARLLLAFKGQTCRGHVSLILSSSLSPRPFLSRSLFVLPLPRRDGISAPLVIGNKPVYH